MTEENIDKNEEKKLELSPLEIAEAEAAEFKSSWQRALADYQNLKKETMARRVEWAQMSEQQILEEFIPVYDNFKTAFNAVNNADASSDTADTTDVNEIEKRWKNWSVGIEYIMKQFGEVLKSHGVEEIVTVGEMFDPTFHESAGSASAPADAKAMADEGSPKSGIIVREVSGGYKMGKRVLKPARVIISK